jgi:hypothetical protein
MGDKGSHVEIPCYESGGVSIQEQKIGDQGMTSQADHAGGSAAMRFFNRLGHGRQPGNAPSVPGRLQ